jgi:hypothetical protein
VRRAPAAPQTEPTREVWRSVAGAVGDLAARLGATEIELEGAAPAAFRTALR